MARGAARAEACPDIAAIFERVFEVAAFSEEIKYFLKYYLQDCVCDGANVPSARDIYDFKLILCQFQPHRRNA